MKRYLPSLLFTSFFSISCASSIPISGDTVVVSEISVAKGRNPVLFVGRNPEDGQWILLSDERATREVVVYALFQDLLTLDSTLRQVRDLRVGWQATRLAKGARWLRSPYSMTSQVAEQELSQGKPAHRLSEPVLIRPEHYMISVSYHNEGSSEIRRANVEEKSISVWLVEGSENRVETLLCRDSLTPGARASLDSLVQMCGLDTLKELYTNPVSLGNTEFMISIWDPNNGRSVWTQLKNCWVPSLYELCSYINSLLPKRYAMKLVISERTETHKKE